MKRPVIAITGLHGAIGKRLISMELFNDWNIVDLYRTYQMGYSSNVLHVPMDLTDDDSIQETLERVRPEVILHMAAVAHIDTCEHDRDHGKNGLTWKVNVQATEKIAQYAKSNNCFLIYLSTECVFDGKKDKYTEHDAVNPINWYGVTKAEAESRIIEIMNNNYAIVRSNMAYHPHDEQKTIFGKVISLFEKQESFQMVDDQYMTPTFTDDILKGIKTVIETKESGINHVVPREVITPFDFGIKVAKRFGYDEVLLKPISILDFFGKERAKLRLKHACLDGIMTEKKLQFVSRSVDIALQEMVV